MLCVVLSVAGAMLCSFIVAVFYAACVAASHADEVADELYEKRRKELCDYYKVAHDVYDFDPKDFN